MRTAAPTLGRHRQYDKRFGEAGLVLNVELNWINGAQTFHLPQKLRFRQNKLVSPTRLTKKEGRLLKGFFRKKNNTIDK
jgi:hypothetical protein